MPLYKFNSDLDQINATNKQIPYGNSDGVLESESGFEYDPATNTLTVENLVVTNSITGGGSKQYIQYHGYNYSTDITDGWSTIKLNASDTKAQYTGSVLNGYTSMDIAQFVLSPQATGTLAYNIAVRVMGSGESRTSDVRTLTGQTASLVSNQKKVININTGGLFNNLNVGDDFSVELEWVSGPTIYAVFLNLVASQ